MLTSTLWIVQRIGQLSASVQYNQADLTYNDVNTQYGGTYTTLWLVQPSGQ